MNEKMKECYANLNEFDVAKLYEGKPYNSKSLRKIAKGYGETGAIVYYAHLSKAQFELFGITEDVLEDWMRNDIFFGVYIDLDETSNLLKLCSIVKKNKNRRLAPTQQEIRIFRRIMDYITK